MAWPILVVLVAAAFGAFVRADTSCANQHFLPCHPNGAKTLQTPNMADRPASVYTSLMTSVCTDEPKNDEKLAQSENMSLCCHSGSECRVLKDYNVPFCFDRESTEFAFADGSSGFIRGGQYTDTYGDSINLITGNYHMVEGKMGNVFEDGQTKDKPVKSDDDFDPQCHGKYAQAQKNHSPIVIPGLLISIFMFPVVTLFAAGLI